MLYECMLAIESPFPNQHLELTVPLLHVGNMLLPKCLRQQCSGVQTSGCIANESCFARWLQPMAQHETITDVGDSHAGIHSSNQQLAGRFSAGWRGSSDLALSWHPHGVSVAHACQQIAAWGGAIQSDVG